MKKRPGGLSNRNENLPVASKQKRRTTRVKGTRFSQEFRVMVGPPAPTWREFPHMLTHRLHNVYLFNRNSQC